MLAGIDEGLPYRVDPVPLNATGELVARLHGRRVFAFVAQKATYRDASRMKGDEKYGRPPVLAKHECGFGQAEWVASEHVGRMASFMAGWRRVHSDDPEPDHVLEQALMTIGELLNGRIIDDRPPF